MCEATARDADEGGKLILVNRFLSKLSAVYMFDSEVISVNNRYVPNETTCPVALDVLALLLRSDDSQMADIIGLLPESQRASLATFCYRRSHLRSLSFQIASQCSATSLVTADGGCGVELFDQSRGDASSFDTGRKQSARRPITLSRGLAA